MKRAAAASAAFLIMVGAAWAVVAGTTTMRAEATDGTLPNASCASSAPCLEEDNTSTGSGVKGTSAKGSGIIGTTKAKGTSPTTAKPGVLGQDLQTGGGNGNAGVEGTSTNGRGVYGIGGFAGVEGEGLVGVYGSSSAASETGVLGFSSGQYGGAVVGQSSGPSSEAVVGIGGSTTNDVFFANGGGGNLFRGNNSHAVDVFVVDDAGNTKIGGNALVTGGVAASGVVQGGSGLFGSQSASYGATGDGAVEGVEAINSPTGDAFYANGYGGNLFRGNNSQGFDVFYVNDAGDVFAKGYFSSIQPRTLQKTAGDQTVETYASQSTQPTLEDVGEAQLVNGSARVALDARFAASIDARAGYVVMVTPEGMTHGTLCVTQRTLSGFTVQENMDGRSSVPFAYRLVAKPYGSTAARLPLASGVPAHFERFSGAKTRPVVPRVPPLVHSPKIKIPAHPMR